MGAVYLAYDRDRDMRVALKTLRRADPSSIYRFKREFRSLAGLQHPNLVVLHDLFAEGTEWYFTMEYVDGLPFLDYLCDPTRGAGVRGTRDLGAAGSSTGAGRETPAVTPVRDEAILRHVLVQIAAGINCVHEAGKLHRDLKPDNVLITPDGRAVVLDFGIAVEREDVHGTLEAGVMGTPAYMSPEQAAGIDVGASTDWYSLGAMLYEALTGVVPFDGNYLDVIRDKQRRDPLPPRDLVSGVPSDLNDLCMQLLQRDPAQRPDGHAIIRALEGRDSSVERAVVSTQLDDSHPFVGRDAQLRELERALRATDRGSPVVALVHGGTGMGKTALVERFIARQRGETRLTSLKGRCYERELVPYKAFDNLIDSLSRYLRRTEVVHAADSMPSDIHALAQLFPVLNRVELIRKLRRRTPPPKEPRALRAAAFAALKALLRRLSEQRPLILFIDDLQWGDADSARLMTELISGDGAPAMLLICTYRTGDVGGSPCLRTLFEHTRDNPAIDARQIPLDPLTDEEIRNLCGQLAVGATGGDVDQLVRDARGNPYLLTELLGGARVDEDAGDVSSGIMTLSEALSERVAALNPEARQLLELVAVAGRPLSESLVARVLSPKTRMHVLFGQLHAHKLVRGVGTVDARAIEIYHDGIRRAVVSEIGTDKAKAWHRRLADAIEAMPDTDLAALTEHLIGAEAFGRASITAIRAAVHASRVLAFDKAAELYAIAVKHHEDSGWRQELTLEWAEALVNAGRSAEAADVFLEAAQHTSDPQTTVLQRKAGVQLMLSGQVERGQQALRSVFQALGLQLSGHAKEARRECAQIHEEIQGRGFWFTPRPSASIDPAELERFDAIWEIAQAFTLFDPLSVMPAALRNVQAAMELGDIRRVVPALCSYHMYFEALYMAAHGQTSGALAAAEALSHEANDAHARAWVAMARGSVYHMQGLFKPALLHLSQAEETFRTRCTGAVQQVRVCRQLMAYLFTVLGQARDFAMVEQWIDEADERDDLMGAIHLRLLAVHGALADDDRERAELYAHASEDWNGAVLGATELLSRLAQSRLALYSDDADGARRLSAQLSAPVPMYAVPAWRADGWLQRARHKLLEARGTSQRDALLEEVENAMAHCESTGVMAYADHLALCQAALCHLRGDDLAATAVLDSVLDAGEHSGDGRLILACALLRKGQLAGASEREGLIAEAKERLILCGVRRPVRFARIYAPGFADPPEN